jgi:hypothetical protein
MRISHHSHSEVHVRALSALLHTLRRGVLLARLPCDVCVSAASHSKSARQSVVLRPPRRRLPSLPVRSRKRLSEVVRALSWRPRSGELCAAQGLNRDIVQIPDFHPWSHAGRRCEAPGSRMSTADAVRRMLDRLHARGDTAARPTQRSGGCGRVFTLLSLSNHAGFAGERSGP